MSPINSSTVVRPTASASAQMTPSWIVDLGGAELAAFKDRHQSPNGPVSAKEMRSILDKSSAILGTSVDPNAISPATSTALVVGKVQSGKTLSFTSLIAMAHDNGFGLIVVLAGTKNILSNQSLERLETAFSNPSGSINWIFTQNPSLLKSTGTQFLNSLERWKRNKTDPRTRRVCVAILLKEKTNLPRFKDVLDQVDMSSIPTLIIDDEADQASLNTHAKKNLKKKTNTSSRIYSQIMALRSALPLHTYVQYTATPQATLLLNLVDTLNPDTVYLLKAGSDYTGGETFFQQGSPYVEIIPPQDLLNQRAANPSCPTSLAVAFATFIFGSALELKDTNNRDVRSMMIHPSHQNFYHREYERFVTSLRDEWIKGILNPASSALIHTLIHAGRAVIARTFPNRQLPTTTDLEPEIIRVLDNLEIREVNFTKAGRDEIKWNTSPFWCLVGGANLDRGFTVEGLTVTYMPRPLGGTGSADTMQQRARFFGYKKKYLPYCRVFLEGGIKQAFDDYVNHENTLHQQLEKNEGKSLSNWKRIFILDRAMKLTRSNVIGIETETIEFAGWKRALRLHDDDVIHRQKNYSLFTNFISSLGIRPVNPATAHPQRFIDSRGQNLHELYQGIPLKLFLDYFVDQFSVDRKNIDDEVFLRSLSFIIDEIIKNGNNGTNQLMSTPLTVDFFVMRGTAPAARSIMTGNTIDPFQGRNPSNELNRANLNYGGDRDFFFADSLSVQLHFINIKGRPSNGGPIPWLCYRLPERFRKGLVHVDKSR